MHDSRSCPAAAMVRCVRSALGVPDMGRDTWGPTRRLGPGAQGHLASLRSRGCPSARSRWKELMEGVSGPGGSPAGIIEFTPGPRLVCCPLLTDPRPENSLD